MKILNTNEKRRAAWKVIDCDQYPPLITEPEKLEPEPKSPKEMNPDELNIQIIKFMKEQVAMLEEVNDKLSLKSAILVISYEDEKKTQDGMQYSAINISEPEILQLIERIKIEFMTEAIINNLRKK